MLCCSGSYEVTCGFCYVFCFFFFFSSRRRHTRLQGDWSSDVCSSDLVLQNVTPQVMAVLNLTGLVDVFTIEEGEFISSQNNSTKGEETLPQTHPSVRSDRKSVV